MKSNLRHTLYKPHEYFSVARGEKYSDKFLIYINKGGIFRFSGNANNLKRGYSYPPQEEYSFLDQNFSREESVQNGIVEVNESSYDTNLAVGEGDKLYLKCEFSLNRDNSPLILQVTDYTLLIQYTGESTLNGEGMSASILYDEYDSMDTSYFVSSEYKESFESNDSNLFMNFLIAEFNVRDKLLIKNQIHSGILFIPRLQRLSGGLV